MSASQARDEAEAGAVVGVQLVQLSLVMVILTLPRTVRTDLVRTNNQPDEIFQSEEGHSCQIYRINYFHPERIFYFSFFFLLNNQLKPVGIFHKSLRGWRIYNTSHSLVYLFL